MFFFLFFCFVLFSAFAFVCLFFFPPQNINNFLIPLLTFSFVPVESKELSEILEASKVAEGFEVRKS